MAMNDWQQFGGYNSYRSGYGFSEDRRPYERFGYGFNYGYPYEPYGFQSQSDFRRGEHTWQGGVLGWLGAGIRAGASWFGDRLQTGEPGSAAGCAVARPKWAARSAAAATDGLRARGPGPEVVDGAAKPFSTVPAP